MSDRDLNALPVDGELSVDLEPQENIFIVEARADVIVIEMESKRLATSPGPETASELLRRAHALAQNASYAGMRAVAELARACEEMLERVWEGSLPVDDEVLTLLGQAAASLRRLVDADLRTTLGADEVDLVTRIAVRVLNARGRN